MTSDLMHDSGTFGSQVVVPFAPCAPKTMAAIEAISYNRNPTLYPCVDARKQVDEMSAQPNCRTNLTDAADAAEREREYHKVMTDGGSNPFSIREEHGET